MVEDTRLLFITCAAVLLHQISDLVKLISIHITISIQIEHFKSNLKMPVTKSWLSLLTIHCVHYLLDVDNTVRRKM